MTAPGRPDKINSILDSHVKGHVTTGDEVRGRNPICLGCNHAWPCDTAVLAEELTRVDGVDTVLRDALDAFRPALDAELTQERWCQWWVTAAQPALATGTDED